MKTGLILFFAGILHEAASQCTSCSFDDFYQPVSCGRCFTKTPCPSGEVEVNKGANEERKCEPCTNFCENGANCEAVSRNNIECICAPGYGGSKCEELEDCFQAYSATRLNPCQNGGSCVPHVQPKCICQEGYFGSLCDLTSTTAPTPSDACSPNPCHTYGACVLDSSQEGGFKCECVHGLSGKTCDELSDCRQTISRLQEVAPTVPQSAKDPCQSEPGRNGVCSQVTGACDCTGGYSDTFCTVPPLECALPALRICPVTVPPTGTTTTTVITVTTASVTRTSQTQTTGSTTKTPCSDTEFECMTSGICIPGTWRCDNFVDCTGDTSDEDNCETQAPSTTLPITTTPPPPPSTSPTQAGSPTVPATTACDGFSCTSGTCIPAAWRCDDYPDCPEGDTSDEDNCDTTSAPGPSTSALPNTTTPAASTSGCASNEFQCTQNKKCIPENWKCDNFDDCQNGDTSDEDDCPTGSGIGCGSLSACSDGTGCIEFSDYCDGENDCENGEDELFCRHERNDAHPSGCYCEVPTVTSTKTTQTESSATQTTLTQTVTTKTDTSKTGSSITSSSATRTTESNTQTSVTSSSTTTILKYHGFAMYLSSNEGRFIFNDRTLQSDIQTISVALKSAFGNSVIVCGSSDADNCLPIQSGATHFFALFPAHLSTWQLLVTSGGQDMADVLIKSTSYGLHLYQPAIQPVGPPDMLSSAVETCSKQTGCVSELKSLAVGSWGQTGQADLLLSSKFPLSSSIYTQEDQDLSRNTRVVGVASEHAVYFDKPFVRCAFQVFDEFNNHARGSTIPRVILTLERSPGGQTITAACQPNEDTGLCTISTEDNPLPLSWFDVENSQLKMTFALEGSTTAAQELTTIPIYHKGQAPELTEETPISATLPQSDVLSNDVVELEINMGSKNSPLQTFWAEVSLASLELVSIEYDHNEWNIEVTELEEKVVLLGMRSLLLASQSELTLKVHLKITEEFATEKLVLSANLKFLATLSGILVSESSHPGGLDVKMMGRDDDNTLYVSTTSVIGLFAFASRGHLMNTAVLTGNSETVALKIFGFVRSGALLELSDPSLSCGTSNAAVLQVQSGCGSVLFEGTETESGDVTVLATLPSGVSSEVKFSVWRPNSVEFKVDTTLHSVSGTCGSSTQFSSFRIEASVQSGSVQEAIDVTNIVCSDACAVVSSDDEVFSVMRVDGRWGVQGKKTGQATLSLQQLGLVSITVSDADPLSIQSLEIYAMKAELNGNTVTTSSLIEKGTDLAAIIGEVTYSDGTKIQIGRDEGLRITDKDNSLILGSSDENHCVDNDCVFAKNSGPLHLEAMWKVGDCEVVKGRSQLLVSLKVPTRIFVEAEEVIITHETDLAVSAGIAFSSAIVVYAEYDGLSTRHKISVDNIQVQETSGSGMLTYSVIGGQSVVRVSQRALTTRAGGKATIQISFQSATTNVEFSVVFASSMSLIAYSYPSQSNQTISSASPLQMKLVEDTGLFQEAAMSSSILLTDGETFDVTPLTTFRVANSPEWVAVKRETSGDVILRHLQINGEGIITVTASLTRASRALEASLSFNFDKSTTVTVVSIDSIQFPESIVGQAGTSVTAKASVTLSDGRTITSFSGLLSWSSTSKAVTADGDAITLVDNSPTVVTLTARSASQELSTTVICNLLPNVGELDIGQESGLQLDTPVVKGSSFELPLRVNLGSQSATSIKVRVSYDSKIFQSKGILLGSDLQRAHGALASADASVAGVISIELLTPTGISCEVRPCDTEIVLLKFEAKADINSYTNIFATLESIENNGVAMFPKSSSLSGNIEFGTLPGSVVINEIGSVTDVTGNKLDVVSDGRLNLQDVQFLRKVLLTGDTEMYDANLDSEFNLLDVQHLLQVVQKYSALIERIETKSIEQYDCKFSVHVATLNVITEPIKLFAVLSADTNIAVSSSMASVGSAGKLSVWEIDTKDPSSLYNISFELDGPDSFNVGVSIVQGRVSGESFFLDPLITNRAIKVSVSEHVVQLELPDVGPVSLKTHSYAPYLSESVVLDTVMCETDSNSCIPQPCENNGVCTNLGSSGYKCDCLGGFSGLQCEITTITTTTSTVTSVTTLDPCLGEPCIYGECKATESGYTCICQDGNESLTCPSPCEGMTPCQNFGTCSNDDSQPLGYKCGCTWAYAGQDCDTHVCEVDNGGCIVGQGTCNPLASNEAELCACVPPYEGLKCDIDNTPLSPGSNNSEMSQTLIGAILVACIIVLVAVPLLLIQYRRRHRESANISTNPLDWKGVDTTLASESMAPPYTAPADASSVTYNGSGAKVIKSAAAQVKHMESKLDTTNGQPEYEKEFAAVPKAMPGKTSRVSDLVENKSRNRYRNIYAYDDTRVRLLKDENDYINANHVVTTVDSKQFWYVATQGPTPETIGHFWEMVWEQQSKIILMLTNETEMGRVKCEKYFPDTESEEVTNGDLAVSLSRKRSCDTYTIRGLKVRHLETGETRTVWHLHYTAWPDHGVPEESYFLAFIDEVRSVRSKLSEGKSDTAWPVVTHCSAGIGRTGVFMATEIGLAKLEAGELVDLQTILEELREQRYGLVQTQGQYQFIYQALIKALYNSELIVRGTSPST
eukprot:m.43923 g.43923  ORF g.43923 m.43923 type:complete len:2590 (+) comp10023_c0_seq1:219-7988(+)